MDSIYMRISQTNSETLVWEVGSKPVQIKRRCVTDESHVNQQCLISLALLISVVHTV